MKWASLVLSACAAVPAVALAQPDSGVVFQDCPHCPEMIVIPSGQFVMGSATSEPGRRDNEGPQRLVTVSDFALGRYEVTVGQFAAFVAATGHETNGCRHWSGGDWVLRTSLSWRDPGFAQLEDHPVTCVGWEDARAYVRWLARTIGHDYRLPSEAEWEYAARAGTVSARYWGDDALTGCEFANTADLTARGEILDLRIVHCHDGHVHTSPVGSLLPNKFGLHDMLGNVSEWLQDCWNEGYHGAPTDGTAWQVGDCAGGMLRGGSWLSGPDHVRSADRGWHSGEPSILIGIRVARAVH